MENKIDISVIIPMYNSEKYIVNTISSILSQEAHGLNYEIIVVDDFSKDNSREVVRNLKNDKIKLIELDKNGGLSNARNSGIKIAKGEWIEFVDSDDKICKDLFKKFESSLKPDINCYVFSIIREYPDRTLKQTITDVKDKRAFAYLYGVWNKFIKRDICIEFKKNYLFEDNIFNVEMMINNELKISLIDDAYYIYNCNNEHSIMSNFNKMEYLKMYSYIYNQIDKSDELTKMYILEVFVGILFSRKMPFFMSLKVATKTLFKLYRFIPRVYVNGIRNSVISTQI